MFLGVYNLHILNYLNPYTFVGTVIVVLGPLSVQVREGLKGNQKGKTKTKEEPHSCRLYSVWENCINFKCYSIPIDVLLKKLDHIDFEV